MVYILIYYNLLFFPFCAIIIKANNISKFQIWILERKNCMEYQISRQFDQTWHNYIHCTCWSNNKKVLVTSLSKKKMLKFFAEKEQLDELHLFLLDNIIQAISFVYSFDESELQVNAYGDTRIILNLNASSKVFEDIIANCAADKD